MIASVDVTVSVNASVNASTNASVRGKCAKWTQARPFVGSNKVSCELNKLEWVIKDDKSSSYLCLNLILIC